MESGKYLERFSVCIVGFRDNEARGIGWATAKTIVTDGIGKV